MPLSVKRKLVRYLLPLISGFMTALAYQLSFMQNAAAAPFNNHALYSLLAWIALVPFFMSLESGRARANFFRGLLFGIGVYSVTLLWFTHSMTNYGGLSKPVSVFVLALAVIYVSSYPAIFASLFDRFGKGYRGLVPAASVWVLLEYIRGYVMTGFPWVNLAYTQGRLSWMIQSVDTVGIYGICWLIVFTNLLIAQFLRGKDQRRPALPFFMFLLIAISLNSVYGFYVLTNQQSFYSSNHRLDVALVQGNVDQALKWQSRYRKEIIRRHVSMTNAALKTSNLVVWPEASYPYSLTRDQAKIHFFNSKLEPTGNAAIILGASSYDSGSKQAYNSAYLIDAGQKIQQRYDKMRLVLYGEFVPFAEFAPIKKLTKTIGNFTAGRQPVIFKFTDHHNSVWRAGPLICYEAIFPEISRYYARNRADFIVNITNDAWFGTTSGPHQHLNMTRFRAIETRRFVVRSANTGISAFISPTGQIVSSVPLESQEVLRGSVFKPTKQTFYSRFGDWPFFLMLCFSLVYRKSKES